MMWLIHMWVPITHIILIMTHYIPTLTIRSSCKTIVNTIALKGSLYTIVLTLVHICIVSSICISRVNCYSIRSSLSKGSSLIRNIILLESMA